MPRLKNVRVWKLPLGVWVWECRREACLNGRGVTCTGASTHWEIAQHYADEHVREHHRRVKHLSHDMGTPPGGTHYEWSDTGMHVRVRDEIKAAELQGKPHPPHLIPRPRGEG